METRPNYLIVGGFVLVIVAGLIGFIAWIVKADIETEYDYYHTYFTGSVSGLSELSEVRYRGVPVGRVVDVGIDEDNVERVEVLLELESGTPIKEDSVASVEMQGITGLSYVLISGGHHESPKLVPKAGEEYPVMASQQSRLQEIFADAPDLINRAILLIDSATRLLSDENVEAVTTTLANVRDISTEMRETSGRIDTFLDDVTVTAAELRGTATELRGEATVLAGRADETLVAARDMLQEVQQQAASLGDNAGLAIGDARLLMADLRETATSLGETGDMINEMIDENREPIADFTQDGLYEFASLIDEMRILVSSLTRIAEQLEADPSGYLFGGSQQGFEAQ